MSILKCFQRYKNILAVELTFGKAMFLQETVSNSARILDDLRNTLAQDILQKSGLSHSINTGHSYVACFRLKLALRRRKLLGKMD